MVLSFIQSIIYLVPLFNFDTLQRMYQQSLLYPKNPGTVLGWLLMVSVGSQQKLSGWWQWLLHPSHLWGNSKWDLASPWWILPLHFWERLPRWPRSRLTLHSTFLKRHIYSGSWSDWQLIAWIWKKERKKNYIKTTPKPLLGMPYTFHRAEIRVTFYAINHK